MTDNTPFTCPVCGGRLCVDAQRPDRIYCDTCEYESGALCERGATESEVYDRDNHEVRWCKVCAAVCPLAPNDHLVICKHFKELPL